MHAAPSGFFNLGWGEEGGEETKGWWWGGGGENLPVRVDRVRLGALQRSDFGQ